jgi:hypothetical protein
VTAAKGKRFYDWLVDCGHGQGRDDMHATLAYLNAAARRKIRSTPRIRAFWKVMHSLLATGQGVSRIQTKPPCRRSTSQN